MDFFKFKFITDPTNLDQGEAINGITSATWVERYAFPGEFSFEAKLSSGLKDFLPLGTLISHADSYEIMIVENHEIKETKEDDPILVISGRSFISYFENRIVGVNNARTSVLITPYDLAADFTWNQAVKILQDNVLNATDVNDRLPNVTFYTPVTGTGVSVARTVDRGTVLDRVLDLLQIDDLGIKTIRKNTFGVIGNNTLTYIYIYKGVDRSSSIIFSWKGGDLASADYLFTLKSDKNAALVVGQYVFATVETAGLTKYDRRTMIVDAADLDEGYGGVPPAGAQTSIAAAMRIRGQLAIATQNRTSISQADISNTSKYKYRKDYNIGDLISLDGNFGQIAVMRVIEYAEIEDENGESGHPTLAFPGA